MAASFVTRSEFHDWQDSLTGYLDQKFDAQDRRIEQRFKEQNERLDRLEAIVRQNTDDIQELKSLARQNTDDIRVLAALVRQNSEEIIELKQIARHNSMDIIELKSIARSHSEDIKVYGRMLGRLMVEVRAITLYIGRDKLAPYIAQAQDELDVYDPNGK